MTATEHQLRAYLQRREARGAALTSAERVLARAAAGQAAPAPRLRLRLAPVLAAAATLALVGGALSAGLALHRGGGTAPGQAHPRLVVPSTPPPPGVSLIWYGDPDDPARLVAVDWTGRPVGSIPIPRFQPPSMMPATLQPAPDGQRLLLDDFSARVRRLLTGQGATLGQVAIMDTPPNSFDAYPARFTSDGSALCETKGPLSDAAEASLVLVDSAGGERHVADLGTVGGDTGLSWGVADCSVARDRAVLTELYQPRPVVASSTPTVQNAPGRASVRVSMHVSRVAPVLELLRIVRLSDGATVAQRTVSEQGWGLTTSADGTLYAVSGRSGAVIRSVDSGAQVGAISGAGVLAFSADDRLVMTSAPGSGKPGVDRLDVLDWRSGTHVWSGSFPLAEVVARPDTGDFLVISRIPSQGDDLVVVHADGTATRIASNVQWNSGTPCPDPCTTR
jgi:hypothetical protein